MIDKIVETYNTKIEDGTLNKIVEKNLDLVLQEVIRDLFSYNSPVKQTLQDKVGKAIEAHINSMDFDVYFHSMTNLIKSNLNENNALASNEALKVLTKSNLKRVESLMPKVYDLKIGDELTVEELFNLYDTFIEKNVSLNDLDVDSLDNSDGYYNLETELEIEDQNSYETSITFMLDSDVDSSEIYFKTVNIQFGKVKSDLMNLTLKEINNLDAFDLLLLHLDNQHIKIIDIDKCDTKSEVLIEAFN